jgi:hypothetical protein
VVNLVSETQWKTGRNSSKYSFENPEVHVRSYLTSSCGNRFRFRTWEGLYDACIKGEADLADLDTYVGTKSAHFRRAFELA